MSLTAIVFDYWIPPSRDRSSGFRVSMIIDQLLYWCCHRTSKGVFNNTNLKTSLVEKLLPRIIKMTGSLRITSLAIFCYLSKFKMHNMNKNDNSASDGILLRAQTSINGNGQAVRQHEQ